MSRGQRVLWALGMAIAIVASGCSGDTVPRPSETPSQSEGPVTSPTPEASESEAAVVASCATDGDVADIAVVDDLVIMAGEFESVIDADGVPHARDGLAACTTTGQFVEDFVDPLDGLVRVLALDGDRLVAGGNFAVDGGGEQIAYLDPRTGEVIPGAPVHEVAGSVHAITGSDDGSLYFGGAFSDFDGVRRQGLARVMPNGQLDMDFAPKIGRTPDDDGVRVVYTIAEHRGRVYIGGDFGSLNDTEAPGVGAIDSVTGRVTSGFEPELTDRNPVDGRVQVRRILPRGDWVYLCGDWWITEGRGNKSRQRNLGRFTLAGRADRMLEPSTDGGVRDCALIEDWLVVGGHFDEVSGQRVRKLVLVSLVDGSIQPVVDIDSPKGVQAVEVVGNRVYVGGTFTRVAGSDQPGLAAIRLPEVS